MEEFRKLGCVFFLLNEAFVGKPDIQGGSVCQSKLFQLSFQEPLTLVLLLSSVPPFNVTCAHTHFRIPSTKCHHGNRTYWTVPHYIKL